MSNSSFQKTTRLVAEKGLYMPQSTTGGGGSKPVIVNVPAPGGTIAAQDNHWYYIDFNVVGANVVFDTSGLAAADSFYVKIIDPSNVGTGGFTATVDGIVAGDHVESLGAPGTLAATYVLSQPGQEATFTSNDGVNLWT